MFVVHWSLGSFFRFLLALSLVLILAYDCGGFS